MNGTGGTYDCVALMAYYVICKSVTNLDEIEEINENLWRMENGKTYCKDILFLGQKSVPATQLDMNVVMIFGIH